MRRSIDFVGFGGVVGQLLAASGANRAAAMVVLP